MKIAVEKWMFDYGFEVVAGLPQLFILRDKDKKPVVLVAKVADDFLVAGEKHNLQKFGSAISERFKVGRFVLDEPFIFNRLYICQAEHGTIEVSMREFFDQISSLPVTRSRRKEAESPWTADELTQYRRLAGQLNYLGHGILPSPAFVASYLQQFIGVLNVKHLSLANAALHELRKLAPVLRYPQISSDSLSQASYIAFSDASQGSQSYGQTGFISGIYFPQSKSFSVYHIVDRDSSKQACVSFSSVGAEILTAAESTDRAALMAEGIQRLFTSSSSLPLDLTIDSLGLYSTITTLHYAKRNTSKGS